MDETGNTQYRMCGCVCVCVSLLRCHTATVIVAAYTVYILHAYFKLRKTTTSKRRSETNFSPHTANDDDDDS